MKTLKFCFVIAAAGIVLVGCSEKKGGLKEDRQETTLKRVDLRDAVTQVGLLQPKNQVLIKSEVSGIITDIFVKEGDSLKKDAPILAIDKRPLLNERQKMLLRQEKLNLEFNVLKRELEKSKVLLEQGGVSERTFLDNKDQLGLKQIELREIDIDLKDINEKLEKTELRAPIAGTLISLDGEKGEIVVSATTGFSGGTEVGRIANIDSMEVVCQVSEVDYQSISKNMEINIFLETDHSARSTGKISYISGTAKKQEDKAIRSFEVRVDVFSIHPKMVPGINVNVEFVLLKKDNVWALPVDFITQEEGTVNMGKVWVKKSADKLELLEISLGATDFRNTEVLSGLKEGEVVVVKK